MPTGHRIYIYRFCMDYACIISYVSQEGALYSSLYVVRFPSRTGCCKNLCYVKIVSFQSFASIL